MLQFSRALSPAAAGILWKFLLRLPKDFLYAVELRHPDFFRSEMAVAELGQRLEALGCGRVIMDTRALRSGAATDRSTREALQRKPDLPVHPGFSGTHPIIRFVGHPTMEVNEPWLKEWTGYLAEWIHRGVAPYFFVHCPDTTDAPRLARRFHSLLGLHAPLERLPSWPCESEAPQPSQLELF